MDYQQWKSFKIQESFVRFVPIEASPLTFEICPLEFAVSVEAKQAPQSQQTQRVRVYSKVQLSAQCGGNVRASQLAIPHEISRCNCESLVTESLKYRKAYHHRLAQCPRSKKHNVSKYDAFECPMCRQESWDPSASIAIGTALCFLLPSTCFIKFHHHLYHCVHHLQNM